MWLRSIFSRQKMLICGWRATRFDLHPPAVMRYFMDCKAIVQRVDPAVWLSLASFRIDGRTDLEKKNGKVQGCYAGRCEFHGRGRWLRIGKRSPYSTRCGDCRGPD